jgi:alcohol dehydrogenase class IV
MTTVAIAKPVHSNMYCAPTGSPVRRMSTSTRPSGRRQRARAWAQAPPGRIAANVRTACREPGNRAAREAMMLGATLAGLAFSSASVALVHGMSRPIGAHFHVPHGLSNALVLPHVIRFNLPAAAATYAEIAADAFPHLAGTPMETRATAFAEALAGLSPACALPVRLRDVGVPEGALAAMAADAMKQTRLLDNNPRPLTEADALAIYEQAY